MGKQRKKKDQGSGLYDQAAAESGIEANPHVPPLPHRIAEQVSDDDDDEDETSSPDNAAANRPSGRPSAANVAEEHRQSIANILRSLTGSSEHATNGDELSAKLQRELMGQVINNYEIVNVVSSGGMGDVFGAVHTVMGRKAAIKVLRPEHCGDPALVQRFFNEARAANSIRHPNIVEVLDVGILPAGLPYITMELLEGETLAERLRRLGSMDIDQAVNFAVQAAGALQAAHRQGIVHRDLKPDNLFIVPDPREAGRELIKVLDFGIAKLHGDKLSKVKTNVGSILGTPPYMSPEQCRGIPDGVDHRSDVYALGVILFEMLCGAPPFVADGIGDVMVMHLSSPPPLPTWRRKEIPARIEQTILWALEKNPDQRIPSMADFAFALGVGPTPVPYLATPTGLTAPSFPPLARNAGSMPPPAFDMEPTVADDRSPETAPSKDIAATQHSPSHPPAAAPARAPSLPPPQVIEEVAGGRRWLTSIVWASAAGLLIAAGGWLMTQGQADVHEADHRPHSDDAVERSLPAQAVERVEQPTETKVQPQVQEATDLQTGVVHEPAATSASAADSSNLEVASASAPTTASALTQPAAAPRPVGAGPSRAGTAHIARNRWIPTHSVAEVREALAQQAAANANAAAANASTQPAPEQPGTPTPEFAPTGAPPGPTAEVPAQPKPQTGAVGLLNLAAAPWANVSLNGRVLGVTPLLNLRLPVGVHQLTLSNPELGKSTVVTVEISADKPVSRFVGWQKP